jgi:hypothetical protein
MALRKMLKMFIRSKTKTKHYWLPMAEQAVDEDL